MPRALRIAAAALALTALAGCHVVGHAPPGQVKQVIDPPPGKGGVPPGQAKKRK